MELHREQKRVYQGKDFDGKLLKNAVSCNFLKIFTGTLAYHPLCRVKKGLPGYSIEDNILTEILLKPLKIP